VRFDKPPPGEELNTGEVTEPRQAATLILLRDSDAGPEVLLVQRNPEQRFMGGAWVFPGGAVHDGEDHATAALRELAEEASVALGDPADAVPFSRWVTPREVTIRFDTWFFVAEAPPGAEAACDGRECVDVRWIRPADALAAAERDELFLVFPTIKTLEHVARHDSVAEALASALERAVEPIKPRVRQTGNSAEVLLPGEPGYEET